MWLIMQQDKPEDFVIATGVQHTVRDFTEKAFAANGITIRWEGTGIDEKGYDAATGKMLEMNAIHSAWKNGCKKLEFLGSSCIYPRMAPQPMKENCLLTSELEKTNEAYALAKISGLKYCEFLNRQYGTD